MRMPPFQMWALATTFRVSQGLLLAPSFFFFLLKANFCWCILYVLVNMESWFINRLTQTKRNVCRNMRLLVSLWWMYYPSASTMFHILANETDCCCACVCWSSFLCAPAPFLTINVWRIVLITVALVYHARQFHSCNWCVMLVWCSFSVEVCERFFFALVFFVRSSVLLKVACFFYNSRLVCPCYFASLSLQISHVPFEVAALFHAMWALQSWALLILSCLLYWLML